jgi:nucleotide-binding universal stress UspA family protein
MTSNITTTQAERRPIVLVGVDGSASAAHALRWAYRQAQLTGAELHAVSAWSVPQTYGYVWQVGAIGDLEQDARTMQQETLVEALGAEAAATVHGHLVEAHPTVALLNLATADDLIVVGSHGHGGFVGSLLGSVSHYLVGHAPCPVVVIRTPAVAVPAAAHAPAPAPAA